LGYRLNATEALMVYDLKRIPRVSAAVEIARVLDQDMAQRLNKAAGRRQVLDDVGAARVSPPWHCPRYAVSDAA
jgi:hypothetical protein